MKWIVKFFRWFVFEFFVINKNYLAESLQESRVTLKKCVQRLELAEEKNIDHTVAMEIIQIIDKSLAERIDNINTRVDFSKMSKKEIHRLDNRVQAEREMVKEIQELVQIDADAVVRRYLHFWQPGL